MSVDAKLFVTCGKEMMFEVGNAVTQALNFYSRKKLDEVIASLDIKKEKLARYNFLKSEEYNHINYKYSNGVKLEAHDFRTICFVFGCGDCCKRIVWMNVGCDTDYKDTYEGNKIIFSTACFESSDEIMKVIAEAVKPFGNVYYDHNDCDSEDFVKLF